MIDLTEFKRMNFFTGFFTTAEDWNDGQQYHLEKRKLHNRGLHTSGVIKGEKDELEVTSAGGFSVLVKPGAALDGHGNNIYLGTSRTLEINPDDYDLPQLIYITIKHEESETDRVENVEAPEYSGYTRVSEIPRLEIATTQPDNVTSLELSRIDLSSDVSEISDPQDAANPVSDEIDRRFVVWAGSVGIAEELPPPDFLGTLIQVMVDKRGDFAALADRFPVPAADDVRAAALTLEMLARIGSLHSDQLDQIRDMLKSLAGVEQDVGQKIGEKYPAVVSRTEYTLYQDAVSELFNKLDAGESIIAILGQEMAVAQAALNLAEIVFQSPTAKIANKEHLETIYTSGNEANVALDAGESVAYDAEITGYQWKKTN